MRLIPKAFFLLTVLTTYLLLPELFSYNYADMKRSPQEIRLPMPQLTNSDTLINVLQKRKSTRRFDGTKKLESSQVSLLLWAANGLKIQGPDTITSATRILPSAGGIYPLKIFLAVGDNAIEEIGTGLYYYQHNKHTLELLSANDIRKTLAESCLKQNFISQAPITIIIAADFEAIRKRYGERAERYAHIEAGHAAQNIHLMCESLGLATVEIGAFIDSRVNKVTGIDFPILLVMPVGYQE